MVLPLEINLQNFISAQMSELTLYKNPFTFRNSESTYLNVKIQYLIKFLWIEMHKKIAEKILKQKFLILTFSLNC